MYGSLGGVACIQAIASHFHTVVLSGVPRMSSEVCEAMRACDQSSMVITTLNASCLLAGCCSV
jgi:hypothetical protein